MTAQRIASFRYNAFARRSMVGAVVSVLTIAVAMSIAFGSAQSQSKREVQEPKAGMKYNTAEEAYRAGTAYLALRRQPVPGTLARNVSDGLATLRVSIGRAWQQRVCGERVVRRISMALRKT